MKQTKDKVKKYLIYWDNNEGINGNIIISFDPKKVFLKELIKDILERLQKEEERIKNITIKFMIELK